MVWGGGGGGSGGGGGLAALVWVVYFKLPAATGFFSEAQLSTVLSHFLSLMFHLLFLDQGIYFVIKYYCLTRGIFILK